MEHRIKMTYKLIWLLLIVCCTKTILTYKLSGVDDNPAFATLNSTTEKINNQTSLDSVKSQNISDRFNSTLDSGKAYDVRIFIEF